ncbi:MAG: anthranilate phosphoribosyltransferase [Gemmataceae bacterium]
MNRLFARQDLDQATVSTAMRDLLNDRVDVPLAAAFLSALRTKGESAEEIAAAVSVLRESMVKLETDGPTVDTCGTGGDDAGTFNISTAAAIVATACGARVVKHGNRAVSGKTGSADVLRELGVPMDSGVDWARQSLQNVGFAFCFAPHFHPILAAVAPLRKQLGIRTIFNLLGPLANPAHAPFQLIGVGKVELLDRIAGAVARLGTQRTVLVHGSDGLDEVTLSGVTDLRIVENGTVQVAQWTPHDFGLEPAFIHEILAANAVESAAIVRRVLSGEKGPAYRFVVANAAATLWIAGHVESLEESARVASHAIESGAAARVLSRLTEREGT